jgi:hypothetical protein
MEGARVQVEECAAINGVVVDHDDAVVDWRNPFRPEENIVIGRVRLTVRKPQRIEGFDVLHRRVIGVGRGRQRTA